MKRKQYNNDFKKTIVELYRSGTSVGDLHREYDVSEVTIYNWIKALSPVEGGDGLTPKDIAEIQKENLRLQQEVDIPKKGYGHIREKVTEQEMIDFIEQEKENQPIQLMCRVLDVPKSTYYQSFKKVKSTYEIENEKILERILVIHMESKQCYGAPKIHILLNKEGFVVSLNRVQRIMKAAGIRSVITKKYRPTKSTGLVVERENILKQDFTTTDINQKWVADITYIHTSNNAWCYLASVLDLHTKKIIGYSFSKSMTVDLVLDALSNAITIQQPDEGLIFHTDLGSQYTSDAFEEAMTDAKMRHSFSRKGCPYDNACIESFHATLKKEEVYRTTYTDYESARLALFHYIESWYNRKRIHGAIQ
ncbi:IS3 family transposase, partial [Sporosarcina limicola]